jgi:nucleotide-binding universal stress UspA family protein
MSHWWRHFPSLNKRTFQLAPAGAATGMIGVVVEERDQVSLELVHLACCVAKKASGVVSLLHVIEVPRSLPLNAVLTAEVERAEQVLAKAQRLVETLACTARCSVVQARDAGPAIVEEAAEPSCSLLLIGVHRGSRLGRTVPYILSHASCRVWLMQEAPHL